MGVKAMPGEARCAGADQDGFDTARAHPVRAGGRRLANPIESFAP
jgi:hypothetical protein